MGDAGSRFFFIRCYRGSGHVLAEIIVGVFGVLEQQRATSKDLSGLLLHTGLELASGIGSQLIAINSFLVLFLSEAAVRFEQIVHIVFAVTAKHLF